MFVLLKRKGVGERGSALGREGVAERGRELGRQEGSWGERKGVGELEGVEEDA